MDKNSLENQIINLVQYQDIREQSVLQDALKVRGYDLPQATLSRRLKKLNIAKINGVYRVIQTSAPILPHVMSIKVSKFGFVVIQTLPGNANALAYFLDQNYAHNPQSDVGILGTIAGDDTVLVLIQGPEEMDRALSLLKNHFPHVLWT